MEDAASSARPLHEDVAALRHRVAELEAAKDYAEQIVETVRDPLLVLTPGLRVRSANPAFYHLFQVRPAETEGQLLYQLGHGQWDIPALRRLLEELLPQQAILTDYEVTHTFAQLGSRTILLNARRLDHVPLILLAMEDITVRTHAEASLQQQQAALERQVQERTAALHREMAERQRLEREAQRVQQCALLGRLAAGVSHEIRNPLGAVVLQIELLEEELRDPSPASAAEIPQAFTQIKRALARLNDLVENYLSLVRVGTLQLVPGNLQGVVRAVAENLRPALTAQRITLQQDGLDQLGVVALHPPTV